MAAECPKSAFSAQKYRKTQPEANKMLVLRVSGTSGVSYHRLRGVNLTNTRPSRKPSRSRLVRLVRFVGPRRPLVTSRSRLIARKCLCNRPNASACLNVSRETFCRSVLHPPCRIHYEKSGEKALSHTFRVPVALFRSFFHPVSRETIRPNRRRTERVPERGSRNTPNCEGV